MHYSVEASLGNQFTLEYIVPVGNRRLACQDERLAVVPVVDDLHISIDSLFIDW